MMLWCNKCGREFLKTIGPCSCEAVTQNTPAEYARMRARVDALEAEAAWQKERADNNMLAYDAEVAALKAEIARLREVAEGLLKDAKCKCDNQKCCRCWRCRAVNLLAALDAGKGNVQ